jgi:hypothetical protein
MKTETNTTPAAVAPAVDAGARDMVTREQIEGWAKLAGIEHFTEKGLERLGDFAIFARQARASDAAAGEPVAHFLHDADENLWEHVRDEFKGDADVVPLFRQPPPSLTNVQRKAIEWAIGMASQHNIHKSPLRALLTHPASEPKALTDDVRSALEACAMTYELNGLGKTAVGIRALLRESEQSK